MKKWEGGKGSCLRERRYTLERRQCSQMGFSAGRAGCVVEQELPMGNGILGLRGTN